MTLKSRLDTIERAERKTGRPSWANGLPPGVTVKQAKSAQKELAKMLAGKIENLQAAEGLDYQTAVEQVDARREALARGLMTPAEFRAYLNTWAPVPPTLDEITRHPELWPAEPAAHGLIMPDEPGKDEAR